MRFCSKEKVLTEEQLCMISISAIYAKQQLAKFYTLSPDMGKRANIFLKEGWGIRDSNSAEKVICSLLEKGCSFHFPIICDAFSKENEYIQQLTLDVNKTTDDLGLKMLQNFSVYRLAVVSQLSFEYGYIEVDDVLTAMDYLIGFDKEYATLIRLGVFQSFDEMKKRGVLAWDMGRAVFLARLCFEVGYLKAEQAWNYIRRSYEKAVNAFQNWDEFAQSYILGRALWSGGTDSCDTNGFLSVSKWLHKDPTSPWIKVPFK